MLYGVAVLGEFGRYWMGVVSILAVISTANTVVNSISYLLSGMSRINLVPEIFGRKNKKGAPYIGIITIGTAMTVLVVLSLAASDLLNFFLKVASVFWIIVYLVLHVDVIILRFRMPKVPRTFKVPLGIVIPIIGIIGDVYMIYGIDSDPEVWKNVFVCGAYGILAFLGEKSDEKAAVRACPDKRRHGNGKRKVLQISQTIIKMRGF